MIARNDELVSLQNSAAATSIWKGSGYAWTSSALRHVDTPGICGSSDLSYDDEEYACGYSGQMELSWYSGVQDALHAMPWKALSPGWL